MQLLVVSKLLVYNYELIYKPRFERMVMWTMVVSVALLVVRLTNNRKVLGSMPANIVCITVLTGNRLG